MNTSPIILRSGIPTVGPNNGPVLVYRPGGTAGGNVYVTWAALVAAAILIQGPKTVWFDSSIVSPAVIPAGTWTMGPSVTWAADSSNGNNSVSVTDGAILDFVPVDFIDVIVEFLASTTALVTAFEPDNSGNTTFYVSGTSQLTAGGSSDVFVADPTNTDQVTIIMRDKCTIGSGGTNAVYNASTFLVIVQNQANLLQNAIDTTPNSFGIQITMTDPGASASLTQIGNLPVIVSNPTFGSNLTFYSQTAVATVVNTAAETTLVGTGVGTLNIDTEAAGNSFTIDMAGVVSTDATPTTLQIRVYQNGTLYLDTGAQTIGASLTNAPWRMRVVVPTVATTTFLSQAFFEYQPVNPGPLTCFALSTGATPVNLTPGTINVTATWGAADPADTITCTQFILSSATPIAQ